MPQVKDSKAVFTIQPRPNTGLFEINTTVASIPNKLKGTYTSRREAKLAIDTFRRVNFKDSKPPQKQHHSKQRKVPPAVKAKARATVADGSKVIGESGEYRAG